MIHIFIYLVAEEIFSFEMIIDYRLPNLDIAPHIYIYSEILMHNN